MSQEPHARINRDEALQIYGTFRAQDVYLLEHQRQYLYMWLTIIIAVLSAAAGAFVHFEPQKTEFLFIVLIGPIIVMALCVTACSSYDKAYRRYLENIIILRGLERLIGLRESDSIFPTRWLLDWQKAKSPDDFIAKVRRSSGNMFVYVPFLLFYLLAFWVGWLVIAEAPWPLPHMPDYIIALGITQRFIIHAWEVIGLALFCLLLWSVVFHVHVARTPD